MNEWKVFRNDIQLTATFLHLKFNLEIGIGVRHFFTGTKCLLFLLSFGLKIETENRNVKS